MTTSCFDCIHCVKQKLSKDSWTCICDLGGKDLNSLYDMRHGRCGPEANLFEPNQEALNDKDFYR